MGLLVVGMQVLFASSSRQVLMVCRKQWGETPETLRAGAVCVHMRRIVKGRLESW